MGCKLRHTLEHGSRTLFGAVVAPGIRDVEAQAASMDDTRKEYEGVKRH